MLIVFDKPHGIYLPGQEVDHPHPGVAEVLIGRGIARRSGVVVGSLVNRIAADTTAAEAGLQKLLGAVEQFKKATEPKSPKAKKPRKSRSKKA